MDDSTMSPLPIRQHPSALGLAHSGLDKAGLKRIALPESSAGQTCWMFALLFDHDCAWSPAYVTQLPLYALNIDSNGLLQKFAPFMLDTLIST